MVEDIYARGLDRDVTVVIWGEFGRSPKINKDAGRDHWARVNSALLAGGGMKVGQVIGSTDKLGGSAASCPIHYHDVLATIYHNLGIDPRTVIRDQADRPINILPPTAEPIRDLIRFPHAPRRMAVIAVQTERLQIRDILLCQFPGRSTK